VVDNTNLAISDRVRYIAPAKAAGFAVCGYWFHSNIADSLARNAGREGKARIPDLAIRGAGKRLQMPTKSEGFDSLRCVRIGELPDRFRVEEFDEAR
jgi:hypothetical protein